MAKTIDNKTEKEDILRVKNIIKIFFNEYPKFDRKSKHLSKNSPAYFNLVNYIPHHYSKQTNGQILDGSYINISLKEMGYKLRE